MPQILFSELRDGDIFSIKLNGIFIEGPIPHKRLSTFEAVPFKTCARGEVFFYDDTYRDWFNPDEHVTYPADLPS